MRTAKGVVEEVFCITTIHTVDSTVSIWSPIGRGHQLVVDSTPDESSGPNVDFWGVRVGTAEE